MKRTELMERVREAHARLVAALDGLSEEDATRVGLNANWSVKDALSHVVAWEAEGARIVGEIQQGTWRPHRLTQEEIDAFNARAVEERRGRSMREVTDEFNTAHQRMERVLESLPEEVDEASPAFQYARGVTFRHHAHHAGQIEEWKKKSRES
ncbi:MAG TPA: maleylpyruvate isomerase N-terminal domain-containing protein [Pyrinomonadaceae bacterium]|nr:maleylpyruvate isomerase N-terminal domain-containing protein [Pyrinomonadaceae bacterium]